MKTNVVKNVVKTKESWWKKKNRGENKKILVKMKTNVVNSLKKW